MIVQEIQKIRSYELSLPVIRPVLRACLEEQRSKYDNNRYYAIFRASELTREMEIIADCGLQRDIHKRIADGYLSFNSAWLGAIQSGEEFTRVIIRDAKTDLGRQLTAVYGTHPIISSGVLISRCDEHDYIILLEAHIIDDDQFDFFKISENDLRLVISKLYLAFLKTFRHAHTSDWERAVHELASPLDFIYSNSDFLVYYLGNAQVTDEQRRLKLEDFKLIADLMIKRLHQYRFAFAGTKSLEPRPSLFSVYEIAMPITHLWYHEANRKQLLFNYEGLKGRKLYTDPEILQFILFNLVSNAIKYSHRGKVIRLYSDILPHDRVSVAVANEGIPITASERQLIFEPGYRTDAARNADARGMGIGLSVCRQLAAVLGGRILMLDDTGSETIFELQLTDRRPG